MNFRDLVEKVREHDRHEPEDCECLLCKLFRDLYEANYTIFFSPDVSRMNQEAYDAGKTVTAADIAAAEERGRREGVKKILFSATRVRKGHEYWNPDVDVFIVEKTKFNALLGAKEAGDDGKEGEKS